MNLRHRVSVWTPKHFRLQNRAVHRVQLYLCWQRAVKLNRLHLQEQLCTSCTRQK